MDELGNKLFGKDRWAFDHVYDSETITWSSGNLYYVIMGDMPLYDGCSSSECNKAAYVLSIKDMYHESRHVYHRTKAWNTEARLNTIKSVRRMTDIVRREFVRGFFPSAYYNNYTNDPGEIDTEIHGIRHALIHFGSDPMVGKAEAEEILFELMMSDDYIHKEFMDMHRGKLKSIYDVLDLFEERAETAAAIRYPITADISTEIVQNFEIDPDIDLDMTNDFLHSKKFKEYRKAFDSCKTGIEQDKVLEQAILAVRPDTVRKAPVRLKVELEECRKQMELETLKPGLHAVSPKRINYSQYHSFELGLKDEGVAAMTDNNELKLTDDDLMTIPVSDSIGRNP